MKSSKRNKEKQIHGHNIKVIKQNVKQEEWDSKIMSITKRYLSKDVEQEERSGLNKRRKIVGQARRAK